MRTNSCGKHCTLNVGENVAVAESKRVHLHCLIVILLQLLSYSTCATLLTLVAGLAHWLAHWQLTFLLVCIVLLINWFKVPYLAHLALPFTQAFVLLPTYLLAYSHSLGHPPLYHHLTVPFFFVIFSFRGPWSIRFSPLPWAFARQTQWGKQVELTLVRFPAHVCLRIEPIGVYA